MAKSLATIWDIDPHTLKKHEILRRYFQAWLPIMAKYNGRVLFIDGFAGPGRYKGGEDGSPVIVLQTARDHRFPFKTELVCVFVENKKDRIDHLEQVIKEIDPPLPPNIKHHCVHGRFDEHLQNVLNRIEDQKKKIAPALVFIDPFGFSHTPFKTISQILQNNRCEVLITFMYEEINRFLGHKDHEQTYDALFGSTAWREVLKLSDPDERRRGIHDIYLEQLKTAARFVRSFEMLNKGNRTDYFLFFASNNQLGLEKMKEAMWKVDQTGSFQFSDYTDASRTMNLFGDTDYPALKNLIVEKFRGQEVSIETISGFVITETVFLRSHFKTQILKPMERDGELEVVKAKPGRRKGTFPDRTAIKFE